MLQDLQASSGNGEGFDSNVMSAGGALDSHQSYINSNSSQNVTVHGFPGQSNQGATSVSPILPDGVVEQYHEGPPMPLSHQQSYDHLDEDGIKYPTEKDVRKFKKGLD